MTLSLVLTVHDRPAEVSRQVAESLRLPGNMPDELILVLDRPTKEAKAGALLAYMDTDFPVRTITIPGEPGWLCPARAWNHGFRACSSDLIYAISSEVVQDAGNLDKARKLMQEQCYHGQFEDPPTAIDVQCSQCGGSEIKKRPKKIALFGACHNSTPENLVVGAEPGLLVSAKMTRPLGFIACMPTANVKQIFGFDEKFMGGYWYDDDDFFFRLWKTGLNFVWDDSIHGIHLDHKRPVLETQEGRAGIQRNEALMQQKHGTTNVWITLPKSVWYGERRTQWFHI